VAARRRGGTAHALFPAGGPGGEWLKARMAAEAMDATCLSLADETRVNPTAQEQSSGAKYRFRHARPQAV
jgi:6-phosphofructokinase 2